MFYVILTSFGYKIYQPETAEQVARCEEFQQFKSISLDECEKWIEETYVKLDEFLTEEYSL